MIFARIPRDGVRRTGWFAGLLGRGCERRARRRCRQDLVRIEMEIVEANLRAAGAGGRPERAWETSGAKASFESQVRASATKHWPGLVSARPGLPLWKRGLDLAVILLLSPGGLVVGALVAMIIKFGSKGPLFFRQKRVGYKGSEFTCFKFRTMRENADSDTHRDHTRQLMKAQVPMTKLDAQQDPRLIPFGRGVAGERPGRAAAVVERGARGDEHRGAAAVHSLRIRGLYEPAAAAVRCGAGLDGAVAGEREEPDHVSSR